MSDNTKTSNNVASPCIGNCCLDEQDMCMGCFRLLNEITGWGDASGQQRYVILHNCQERQRQFKLNCPSFR
ncbi:MAG: putative Fe-S protein YdhL (DUF1289 family) [Paraglaciecola sp.]|jgi:predicted Fe-S protein YdhL (DUF1289 family)